MERGKTFRKLKDALRELLEGYPEYAYYGKVEYYLPNAKEKSVKVLKKHKIIEILPVKDVKKLIAKMPKEEVDRLPKGKARFIMYRLAPRGVDLAISMVNLDYSKRVLENSNQTLKYSWEMRLLTYTIIILGAIALYLQFFLR